MTSYCDLNASECHVTTTYETPACMAEVKPEVKPAPKFAKSTAPRNATPRPGYPAYLLRAYDGVLCETL